jgi:diaminopimelate epimerase
MKIEFYKYQGTGNDFVILDNRTNKYDGLTSRQVRQLCDRHFGIGGDGLMMLDLIDNYDFEMKYFNADGHKSSMCGNGGRCLVQFAYDRGIEKTTYRFLAVDGPLCFLKRTFHPNFDSRFYLRSLYSLFKRFQPTLITFIF